jgi:PAS domain S-box-containing protein
MYEPTPAGHERKDPAETYTVENLRALIEASPLAIVALNPDATVTMWNPAAERIFGWTAGEVIGHRLPVVPREKLEEANALRQGVLEGRPFTGREVARQRKDGTRVDVSLSMAPLRGARGEIVGVLAMYADISERRQAQRRLHESEERFRRLAEAAPDVIYRYRLTPAPGFDYVSAAIATVTGYPPEECYAVPDALLHLVHPDDRWLVERLRAAPEQASSPLMLRWVRRDGRVIWMENRFVPVRDEVGAIVAFEGIVSDVTDRVQAYQTLEGYVEERTRELERRMRELEALYRADEEFYGSLELDRVLQALVDVAVEVLEADKATVMVWDDKRERLVVGAARGFRPETVSQMVHVRGEGVTTIVATTGQPIKVEDAPSDPRVAHRITGPEAIQSLMHVPIKISGEVFGVYGVNYCRRHVFTVDEERLLTALAQRAAVAIQNAQLYEQAQQAAAVEERQRLARELHDAVTQTLFSSSLIAEVLPRLLERDPSEARQRLEELRQLTRGALAEMRTLLLELRPAALIEVPLADLLRQLCDAFTGRSRVPALLSVQGHTQLPSDVQVALYRIAQEALNNVAKHARARQVEVLLRCSPERVALTVRDDGSGFDLLDVTADHLGLRIMRERAAAVGAQLDIESRSGHGTRVHVAWHDAVRW